MATESFKAVTDKPSIKAFKMSNMRILGADPINPNKRIRLWCLYNHELWKEYFGNTEVILAHLVDRIINTERLINHTNKRRPSMTDDLLDIFHSNYLENDRLEQDKDSIDYNLLTKSQCRFVDKQLSEIRRSQRKTEEELLLEKLQQGKVCNLSKG